MRISTENKPSTKWVLLITLPGLFFSSVAYSQIDTIDDSAEKGEKPAVSHVTSDAHQTKTEFLRLKEDAQGEPLALQTAITRFRTADGDTIVDLVGAVHIGEGDYYEKLNRQFELYDVVLYELVAPQGTRVPNGVKPSASNPLSFLQQSAQRMLGLESQLTEIDYEKENLLHADLSATQIGEKMQERGDTPLSVGLSAFSEILRNQNKLAKAMKDSPSAANQLGSENIFELMSDPLKMKTMMAEQFSGNGAMELGLGSKLNQMLVVDRNAAALKVLEQEIARGRRNIAIFYGAAHMPDFEKRLIRDFGLNKTEQVWLDAWDLNSAPKTSSSGPTQMLLQMLRKLDE